MYSHVKVQSKVGCCGTGTWAAPLLRRLHHFMHMAPFLQMIIMELSSLLLLLLLLRLLLLGLLLMLLHLRRLPLHLLSIFVCDQQDQLAHVAYTMTMFKSHCLSLPHRSYIVMKCPASFG
jgi:hypothetical protein